MLIAAHIDAIEAGEGKRQDSTPTRGIEAVVDFQVPSGWRVTPQQAIELATTHAEAKCNSKFEQVVFADSENYYVIKARFGPVTLSTHAVAVNGKTGNVSTRT